MLEFWEHLDNLSERWEDNEIDESNLTLGDVGCVAVVKLGNREPLDFLHVSLSEKFHEQQVAPVLTQRKLLCRVGNIGHVEHEFDE